MPNLSTRKPGNGYIVQKSADKKKYSAEKYLKHRLPTDFDQWPPKL